MSQWNTIETAPRDGQTILAFDDRARYLLVYFFLRSDGSAVWAIRQSDDGEISMAKYPLIAWTHVPEPPEWA